MKLIQLCVCMFVSLLVWGCTDSQKDDSDSPKGDTDARPTPSNGEKCDFDNFIPYCASEQTAVNCFPFDGISVKSCLSDEECVIGIHENFFGKKPSAECFKPCTENDVGKVTATCSGNESYYYKCAEYNGKYYYYVDDHSIYCDHGCNENKTDCLKLSDIEYTECDFDDVPKRYVCDNNILLSCDRSYFIDGEHYNYYTYVEDCLEEGKICGGGKCVVKQIDEEYEYCDYNSYKKQCAHNYKLECSVGNYVFAKKCDEGTECVVVDNYTECLKPCTSKDVGKTKIECRCSDDLCSTVEYSDCEKINNNYYYVNEDAHFCNDGCNNDKTKCKE